MTRPGFTTVNRSSGEEIEAFSYFTPAQTEKVVARADKSFQSFREVPVHKRAQLFTELGNILRKNKAQLAKVISTEIGKIFSEATPSGKPASSMTRSNSSELLCVLGECFTKTTLPANIVGMAMRVSCQIGKFQGIIARIGPRGR